jgi:tRNA (guanine37-N1)-methyltransferase
MRIDVFSIFPDIVDGFCTHSLLGRARETGAIDVRTHNIRDFATDVHKTVDDNPFGGGAGILLLGPGGQQFNQQMAQTLAASGGFSMLCGRYEGVDQRVREHLVDHEVSVGDVVLAGGEVAACLIIEAVTRLIPGVMGNAVSPVTESFGADGLLEEPQYTRPAEFRGFEVPEVLRGGDHGRVAAWRQAQALWRTLQQRPDLIEARGGLTKDEVALLEGVAFASYPSMFPTE